MSSQGNTLSACNGGATGLLKDIQRRLSNSGILPVFKQDTSSLVGYDSSLVVPSSKPMKLKNVATGSESYDSLHKSIDHSPICSYGMCLSSVMAQHTMFNKPIPRTKEEILVHARNFIDQYYSSMKRLNSSSHKNRWEQVEKSIKDTGSYQLTETELTFGAKLAWRNAPRCIGRIQWSKLQVFDCRQVTTTTGMFEAICNHIKYGINKGNIRSAITIFPQRTDGKHDFRVWNSQLISYAGYKNPDGSITGDPLHVEFTEICMKLGWKGKGTDFDLLPLVLQSNGHDPDYFDYPPGLIMEVNLEHPQYEWFIDLGLKWYVLPAVASMMLDCGGLEFTGAPFNGWYMSTEIGCRDLCDPSRYNVCERVAKKMGLDTRSNATLWKDRAMVEVNVAVVHSFQKMNVTVVDHHTAAESFMKHYENEQKLRNGCPSDWIWIVPPLSGSITPVFHQELALYHLKPSYDYQESPWRTHVWEKDRDIGKTPRKPGRKFHFKQLARAVKFTSRLFGKALSKRIKVTILYATETGKSETFAKRLFELFGHAFNAQVCRMDSYDISNLEHEALVLVVASTSGNGDPPENGLEFAQNLYKMKMDGLGIAINEEDDKFSLASSKSFIKLNSQVEPSHQPVLDRLDSVKGSLSDAMTEDIFGPLGNIRFAVFALGSSAYPNFCAFGKYVDNLLIELGGERLMKLTTGDEMCAQDQIFSKWARDAFSVACETFCLESDTFIENASMFSSVSLKDSTVRFVDAAEDSLQAALAHSSNRKVITCKITRRENLHKDSENGSTLKVILDTPNIVYEPGDHVGVFPCNRSEIVNGILKHLGISGATSKKSVQLQVLKENHTPNGVFENWECHERLPSCSLETLFTRFLDITTPASPNLLQYLASVATDKLEKNKLQRLATDLSAYEDWRYKKYPHLLEVFEEFPSTKPKPALLVAHLSPLQPRFYSISSSPLAHPGEVHLTVAVVKYRTEHGKGPCHFGVCSNYLNDVHMNDEDMYIFIRSAPGFRLPNELDKPLILVGPGTGIAPFRGFWHHRHEQLKALKDGVKVGGIWLFFGCRTRSLDLYKEEKEEMVRNDVIERKFLALSRDPNIPKTYVQDLIELEKKEVYQKLVEEKGHFYVCGDCTMADNVYQTLKQIIQEFGHKTDQQVESYMLAMRDENRYHEDIFGITLRTAEVHSRSRESARMRMESNSS